MPKPTPEQALSYIGVDLTKYEDEEAFKADFDKDWVKTTDAANNPDIQNRATAKLRSVMRSTLKKHIGAFDLEGIEINDETDPVKLLKELHEPIAKKYGEQISALETAMKDKSGDKVVKEWENKFNEVNKKYTDLNGLHLEQVKKYGELESSVKSEKLNGRIDGYWKDALGQVKFKQGLDELTKEGFVAKMKSEFQLHVDEADSIYTTDKEGKRIADKAKAQKFHELPELLAQKAKEFKLDASNHQGGAPLNRPIIQPSNGNTPQQQPEGRPLRAVHPNLAAMASRQ